MTINKSVFSLLLVPLALLFVGGTLFAVPLSTPPATSADTTDTERLRPLMVALGQDMDRISTGLWYENYRLIEEGARSIANHPRISPEDLATIKETLGQEFQGFVSMDKAVHGSATELVSAAEARDWSGVLTKYTELRDGCLGCHTAYRERLQPVLAPTK